MRIKIALFIIIICGLISQGCITARLIIGGQEEHHPYRCGMGIEAEILGPIIGDGIIGYAMAYDKDKTHDENLNRGGSTGATILVSDFIISIILKQLFYSNQSQLPSSPTHYKNKDSP